MKHLTKVFIMWLYVHEFITLRMTVKIYRILGVKNEN